MGGRRRWREERGYGPCCSGRLGDIFVFRLRSGGGEVAVLPVLFQALKAKRLTPCLRQP